MTSHWGSLIHWICPWLEQHFLDYIPVWRSLLPSASDHHTITTPHSKAVFFNPHQSFVLSKVFFKKQSLMNQIFSFTLKTSVRHLSATYCCLHEIPAMSGFWTADPARCTWPWANNLIMDAWSEASKCGQLVPGQLFFALFSWVISWWRLSVFC